MTTDEYRYQIRRIKAQGGGKMKIGLIDVDGHNFPNIPLMKLSAYHKNKGDTVDWWFGLESYGIVYKSKVFTFTPDIQYMPLADQVIEGGTGYGLKNALPHDIEHLQPDYSLYPQYDAAYGFLTRGCPRKCKFCIVSEKEGCISRRVADLSEFYNGKKVIKLLDANLLACAEREIVLKQLIEAGAHVDFTQGLDIRLIDKDVIQLLNKIKTKVIHFAWDNPNEDLTAQFEVFCKHSNIKDRRKKSVYVLVNYNSTHKEDLHRIYTLRDLGYWPYVMIYDKPNAPIETRRVQRWVNNRFIFEAEKDFTKYKP
jgi:hypothetical protein